MSKKNKVLFAAMAVLIIIGGIFFCYIFRKSSTIFPKTDIILFYGRECPHCQEVEKFITDNKIAEKLKFEQVEVWHNKENADLLVQKAKKCGINEDKIGVPFLYAEEKCYIGAPDVENFFENKNGI